MSKIISTTLSIRKAATYKNTDFDLRILFGTNSHDHSDPVFYVRKGDSQQMGELLRSTPS